jgi:hypothetical protein
VERIRIEMDKLYAEGVYAMQSVDAEWWERSAAQGWLRFLEIARQFHMPASFETIQLFRTTFAYDAVIVRLNKDIDVTKEWETYFKERAKEAKERVKKGLKQRLRGPTDMDYLQMEEFGDALTQLGFQLQRNIENPIIHFRNIVGKMAYIASLFLKLGYLVGIAVGVGLIADWVSRRWLGREIDWTPIMESATTFGWIQLALIAVALIIIRRIVIRLGMPDTRLGPDR